MRGCTICINGDEILRSLCRGLDTPIEYGLRPYISIGYNGTHQVSIGGCYIQLDENDSDEMIRAIDCYCHEYLEKLIQCEDKYDIKEFEISEKGNIKLFKLRQSMCACVLDFINTNKTKGEIQIENNDNMLRISSVNNRLHAILLLSNSESYFWYNEPEFWFELLPNYADNSIYMSNQEWWGPSYTINWLVNCLLPDAISYKCSMEKIESINGIRALMSNDIEYSSNRYRKIDFAIHDDKVLLEVINKLQQFFSTDSSRNLYI